jgi:GDP-4-dehydro-6-deoxy-D-mannose reductase
VTPMVDYLVTGAAGFAGRHLLSELEAREHRVVATYYRTSPPNCANVTWMHCDARSAEATNKIVSQLKPRNIIHLAACSMPSRANEDPLSACETNVNGWMHLLEAVGRLDQPCRVLLVSSYHVYGAGGPPEFGFTEEHPAQPADVYAATRVLSELSARAYIQRDGIDAMIARVGNHVGPGQRAGYFVSSTADQISRIETGSCPPILEVGNIDVRRDISDVRDIVQAYIALLERGRSGQAYNVCSGRAVRLRDVIDIFASMSRTEFEVRVDPKRIRANDPDIVLADRSKITNDTEWAPKIALETTLKDVLEWHRKKPKLVRTVGQSPPVSLASA